MAQDDLLRFLDGLTERHIRITQELIEAMSSGFEELIETMNSGFAQLQAEIADQRAQIQANTDAVLKVLDRLEPQQG